MSAGRTAVRVNPRGTSQRCSQCGETVAKTLAERRHVCACGADLDRDHNAALNVLRLGEALRA
jgi:putative transposase